MRPPNRREGPASDRGGETGLGGGNSEKQKPANTSGGDRWMKRKGKERISPRKNGEGTVVSSELRNCFFFRKSGENTVVSRWFCMGLHQLDRLGIYMYHCHARPLWPPLFLFRRPRRSSKEAGEIEKKRRVTHFILPPPPDRKSNAFSSFLPTLITERLVKRYHLMILSPLSRHLRTRAGWGKYHPQHLEFRVARCG